VPSPQPAQHVQRTCAEFDDHRGAPPRFDDRGGPGRRPMRDRVVGGDLAYHASHGVAALLDAPLPPGAPADALTHLLARRSRAELYDYLAQVQGLLQRTPGQARQLLLDNPQLTKALFQMQVGLAPAGCWPQQHRLTKVSAGCPGQLHQVVPTQAACPPHCTTAACRSSWAWCPTRWVTWRPRASRRQTSCRATSHSRTCRARPQRRLCQGRLMVWALPAGQGCLHPCQVATATQWMCHRTCLQTMGKRSTCSCLRACRRSSRRRIWEHP
jgi:hypothetical protein